MNKTILPYASWPSELSAKKLAEGGLRYGHIQVDEDNLYWLETVPTEGGRQIIKRYCPNTGITNIMPDNYSARSRVHEYGGGDFTVFDGNVVFTNDLDQQLYQIHRDGSVICLTSEPELKRGIRFADMQVHPSGQFLVSVRETHTEDHDPHKVQNDLVIVWLDGSGKVETLVAGADFYAYPRISPDGTQLAWISWLHPNMPWDDTCLSIAKISTAGQLSDIELIMNNENESIYQPSWCPDGELHFVSDRSNWWNIYSLREGILNALTPLSSEFGFPQWQFGIRSYQFIDDNHIAAICSQEGRERMCLVELDSGLVTPLEIEFCYFEGGLQFCTGKLYFIAAGSKSSAGVYCYDIKEERLELISGSSEIKDTANISVAESICFNVGDEVAHAFFYPPLSASYKGPENDRPPLVVMIHGGPTGATNAAFSNAIQYWTTRGFAVVDVNYRGSTGFGRQYRDRLKFNWGIVDVEDCIAVVEYLVKNDRISPEHVAIRGGSAGGYTVYRAIQDSSIFKAGVSRYGVADLTSLAKDTHKFELRYMDQLIGAWPEQESIYIERSPLSATDKLNSPMLLLQGDEDAVVPPDQSERMAAALNKQKIPYHLEILKGEQHGFRKSENIIKALELELNFYRQVFGITADEPLTELTLNHASQLA